MKYTTSIAAKENIDGTTVTLQTSDYNTSRLNRIRAVTFSIVNGFDANQWIMLALTRPNPPTPPILFRAYICGNVTAVPLSAGAGLFAINAGIGATWDVTATEEVGYWTATIPDVFWEGPVSLVLSVSPGVSLTDVHFITDHSLP